MTKSPTISLSGVRQVLKEAQFNPKEAGPMKVVCDMEDSPYYLRRSMENICEALACEPGSDDYHRLLNRTIQLVALARIVE